MEERKKLAKDIKGQFRKKTLILMSVELVFVLMYIIGLKAQIFPFMSIGVIGFFLYFVLSTPRQNMYYYASDLMVCRALVGKEISADPVAEGLERLKKYGSKGMRSKSRTCGLILYKMASGAMAAASILEMIPVVKNFTFIYKNIVNKAYENAAKLIVTYQIGCYEEEDKDMLYDLITYFVQDSKRFLLRTVKSEIKSKVLFDIGFTVVCISGIILAITKNLLFAAIIIGLFVLYMVFIIALGGDDDLETLCEYINYVQNNELDTQLRANIVSMSETGDRVLNIRDAFSNPTDYALRKAAKSASELIDSASENS
ncbi:hypothetical protein SAMN02745247_00302 [Butyrivibrio hungatei DSM 14810]|uniref:Uncharacterized protein n=1 Tax=Butyrivibrio hungatei DSM 14810 TaxID=1121132 RepID=A0A1M7RTI1_9FIRM|nr:hypothetical protein [Butyrivibrio hungatei]SHN49436.1 hypothetical protein SAMN02745247_00302 [Butyrivibrio hungatei DSM 14810]